MFSKKSVLMFVLAASTVWVAAQQKPHVNRIPLSLLNTSVPSPQMAPAATAQTFADQCFDLSKVGEPYSIRCFNEDVVYDDVTGFYGWEETQKTVADHPRQTVYSTAGVDALIPALSVLPPNGAPSLLCASDAYHSGDLAKGALTVFYFNVPADRPVVQLSLAGVIEQSDHWIAAYSDFEQYAQPWITFYAVLDGTEYIDAIDYIFMPSYSATMQGWATTTDANGRKAYWVDWSTMTFDCSELVGHQIQFIFQVFDCAESNYDNVTEQIELCDEHERARLYVSMACTSNEVAQVCQGDKVQLTAPDGFLNYKWYAASNPSVVLCSEQILTVSSHNATDYTCTFEDDYESFEVSTHVAPLVENVSASICEGDSYTIGDQTFYTAGNYQVVIPRTGDCDSIVNLTLTVGQATQETLPDHYMKQGESFQVGDSVFTTVGVHQAITHRPGQCDLVQIVRIIFEDPVPTPEGCVDFAQLGNRDVIRCYNKDYTLILTPKPDPSQDPDTTYQEGNYEEIASPSVHPRQRLMTNTAASDEVIANLKVVPSGAQYAVRCGSDGYVGNDLAKGAQTVFYVTVDATNPVLVFNYAAILQKSNHPMAAQGYENYAQPWGKIWVADLTTGEVLPNPSFEYKPYTNPASVTGGKWSTAIVNGNEYYWKDWESIEMDMSAAIGHKIAFAIETNDCAFEKIEVDGDGGQHIRPCSHHEICRIYASLDCASNTIEQECMGAMVRLIAPEGFASYKWYRSDAPASVLGTNQMQVTSSHESADYVCEVSNGGMPMVITTHFDATIEYANYTIPFGGSVTIGDQTFTQGGDYEVVIARTGDCDSIVKAHIVAEDPVPTPEGCVDFAQLGNRDVIRCYNKDYTLILTPRPDPTQDPDTTYQEGNYEEIVSPSVHPRQRLMTNTAASDEVIANLKVVPAGAQYAVRCGSDGYVGNDLAKGAQTVFYVTVDATNPVLVFNYAAILQKSNHPMAAQGYENYAQPWGKIWVADLTTQEILPNPSFEYKPYTNPASVTGGKWSTATVNGNEYYWKDWESIEMDMSAAIGHKIAFAIETNDCAFEKIEVDGDGGQHIRPCSHHEICRIYASLDCASNTIEQECMGEWMKLTAPEGYVSYRWYNTAAPATTLGTGQIQVVSSHEVADYACELSQGGAPVVATTHVIVDSQVQNETIYEGEYIEIGGQRFSTAGTYEVFVARPNECDLKVILNLTVKHKAQVVYNRTIPEGVLFEFYGRMLNQEGTYQQEFGDSIVVLNLRIEGPQPAPVGDECFDMSQVDDVNTICMDFDLQKIGQVGDVEKFSWLPTRNPVGHPRETFRTTEGLDDLCAELSLLPPGESSSVRLASDGYSQADIAKGQSAIYSFVIDQQHKKFTIQYAAVLETPNHPIATNPDFHEFAQPYMRLYWAVDGQIINQIDHFPSDPASVQGWTRFVDRRGQAAIWKDWETIQLDMSQYVGRKIQVAVEVYDCAEAGMDQNNQIIFCNRHHQAHAYLHVSCVRENDCAISARMEQTEICANLDAMNILLDAAQGEAVAYSLTYSENARVAGFDDVQQQTLYDPSRIVVPLKHLPDTLVRDGVGYQRPGYYQVTVTLHTDCGYDLVSQPLDFTLLYPAKIIAQRWNDVLAVYKHDFNGGYNFSNIEWYRADSVIDDVRGKNASYIYERPNLQFGVPYVVELTRSDDGVTVRSCECVPQYNAPQQISTHIHLTPVGNTDHRVWTLNTETSGSYRVYDVTGKLMFTGQFDGLQGSQTIAFGASYSAGTYMVQFLTVDGDEEVKKVAVF